MVTNICRNDLQRKEKEQITNNILMHLAEDVVFE